MLAVTCNPATIVTVLDGFLAEDPVRHTVFGTLRSAVFDPDAAPWCAATAEHGGAVAVRSHRVFPLMLAGSWQPGERAELARLVCALPDLAGIGGRTDQVVPLAELVLGGGAHREQRQRLFRLDELVDPSGVPGRPRRAVEEDRDLVIDWYREFGAEAHARPADMTHAVDQAIAQRGCWLWEHGDRRVSLATRRPVVAGSARIGPVYTPPQLRGHGYASAVTAAATRDVLTDGAVPVLFTDLANPTTNSIYPQLGYHPVEDRLLVFADGTADSRP